MRSVTREFVWIWIVACGAVCLQWMMPLRAQQPTEVGDSKASFETLLERFSSAPPDWCQGPLADDGSSEAAVFRAGAQELVDRMNDGAPAADAHSEDRALVEAREALDTLKQASARINANWPEESRFRGEVVPVSPLLLVKATFRNRWALYVLGVSEMDDTGNRGGRWRIIETPDQKAVPRFVLSLDLSPVFRGPSRRARFLTHVLAGGCAGSTGKQYRLFEWDPRGFGNLNSLLTIDGVATQEEPSKVVDLSRSFPPAGTLQVDGKEITLPYCWWSAIDTWDNPSLCAADSFDVSGDLVRFRRRVTNRPDLVPVAEAIKHAQAHEYRAVLAYCRSAAVALRIVRETPAFIFADTLKVIRLSDGNERVEFGLDDVYRFEVERGNSGWTITQFRVEHHLQ